jgi:hypothetical protein
VKVSLPSRSFRLVIRFPGVDALCAVPHGYNEHFVSWPQTVIQSVIPRYYLPYVSPSGQRDYPAQSREFDKSVNDGFQASNYCPSVLRRICRQVQSNLIEMAEASPSPSYCSHFSIIFLAFSWGTVSPRSVSCRP